MYKVTCVDCEKLVETEWTPKEKWMRW